MSKCPKCGTEQPKDAKSCNNCGARIENTPTFVAKKSTIAIVVAILIVFVSAFVVYPKVKAHYAAIYKKGMAYYYAQEYSTALPYIQKAADKGNTEAMFTIGEMCKNGYGVKKDSSLALKWYKQAAENGNAEAMEELGNIYDWGINGVERDENESQSWYNQAISEYKKAADKGDANAMFHLGEMYRRGDGTEVNLQEALNWYKKAADNGSITGMCSVAVLYDPYFLTGDQIEVNEEKSIMWYKKAAEAGDLLTMSHLSGVYSWIGNAEEASKWSKKFSEKLSSSKTPGNCKLSVAQEIYTVRERLYTSWFTTSFSYTASREEMYGDFLDTELDCVYNKLKASLSKDKKKALDVEQRKWLRHREAKATAAVKAHDISGNVEAYEYKSAFNSETFNRILYLADYYDKLKGRQI